MTTHDDLSGLSKFGDALEKLEDLMTQSGRAFLLGAGCSKCAGLPLMDELTEKALKSEKLGKKSKAVLSAIKDGFTGADRPNIEDFLSELVDHLAIANRRRERGAEKSTIELGGSSYDVDSLRDAIEEIKRGIADVIDAPYSIDTHWRFVKAVHRPLRPGKASHSQRVDYLILNYDTLIEDALALEKIAFADGIDGGVTGWWNSGALAGSDLPARVMKLHGSIDWSEFPDEVFPRRVSKKINDASIKDRRIVIWPASTKYRETQRDPYAQLAVMARDVLRPESGSQRVLVVCGYRFGDSHINLEIDRALRESEGRLTLVVFWSDNELDGVLKSWHEDDDVSNQVLVFGKRGFWHGATVQDSTADLPWWKFENITRILGGER